MNGWLALRIVGGVVATVTLAALPTLIVAATREIGARKRARARGQR